MLIDYLDVKNGVAAALRDYNNQQFKMECGRDRLTELDRRIMPLNRHVGDNSGQFASVIDKRDAALHGYQQAKDYFAEIIPALDRLTEGGRFMLTVRYIDWDEGGGIEKIMDALHVGRTEAYRRSEMALARLAKLLLW